MSVDDHGLLAAALAKAQAEMPVVKFDSTNPFLKNRYATLGAVIETSRPILAKYGLAISQFPISADGEVEITASNPDKPDVPPTTTKRKGVVSIGVDTILIHESGQFLSQKMFLPMIKEKGKSEAQVAGSMLSYLRRYAWAAVLGLYADEDTDGNDPRGGREEGGFEGASASRTSQSAAGSQSTAQPAKPAPTPKPQPATGANDTKGQLVTALRRLVAANEPEVVRYLKNRKNEKGQVALLGMGLNDLPLTWLEYLVGQWKDIAPKIDQWLQENPVAAPTPAGAEPGPEPEPSNEPAPEDPPVAEEWRTFLMPFGVKKGVPLEKLDKKYLYGLALNYTVEELYKGQPRRPEMIAADRKLRAMLDQAALHYGFKKEESA